LDYLLSRPEVDRTRVGATGNSGGGTLSAYLTALDPRLSMAAPSCFITSYLANVENELPSDSEQNAPRILAAGLDQADLLLCHAPRPTMILTQHDDFFDERFTREAFKDLKKVHALLGSRNSAACFVGRAGHGYHQPAREAMYGFFMKHAGVSGSAKERGVAPVEEKRLYAAPRGQTRAAGSRRVFEFTADTAKALAEKRGKPGAARLIARARKLLALPAVKGPPRYRALRHAGGPGPRGLRFTQFAVESESGIQAIVTCYDPDTLVHPPAGEVLLYVGHISSQDDVSRLPELRTLARRQPLVAVDPRGMGQSAARACGSPDFFAPYGSDFLYASTGEMLVESYLGRRVHDVMRTVDFLLACGAAKVDLLGRGLGSVLVTFAALLHPSRPRARIWDYLPDFRLLTQSPHYKWPLSSMLRGVLKEFDLPDVYRVLGKRLSRSKPWGPMMTPAKTRARRKK
jgi:dienelactone hydrolase